MRFNQKPCREIPGRAFCNQRAMGMREASLRSLSVGRGVYAFHDFGDHFASEG